MMDIAPVNIQMVYPTAATEASNVQHNLNQATNLQQDFESLRQRQDDELKQKQVRNKNEADQRRARSSGARRLSTTAVSSSQSATRSAASREVCRRSHARASPRYFSLINRRIELRCLLN